MGWAGRPDGELLGLIPNQGFDAFITVDRNLQHQQNLANSSFAVVVLVAATNRLGDLIPLVPSLVSTLGTVRPGDVVEIDS